LRVEQTQPSANRQDRRDTQSEPRCDLFAAQRESAVIGALRLRAEAEKILARILADGCDRIRPQATTCKLRKRRAQFSGPILLGARRGPHLQHAASPEQITVAKADADSEATAGGQTPEFRMDAVAGDEKQAATLNKPHRALETVRGIRPRVALFVFARPT